MLRSLGVAVALACAATACLLPASAGADDRSLPMRFDLRLQGPADVCGAQCETWISARGAITADSARDFKTFMQGRGLSGATVVLDSDGGSVLGAIALGREIRKAALATTVGRVIDLDAGGKGANARAMLSPRADCESMCAFVLLGGVQRIVPPQARVMVHQIWLGDRREDPTAATYSAEDLVLVQRDIGRLAQYTADMGGSMALLDLALRIPPWEPLYAMTREEIRATRLATGEAIEKQPATLATSSPATGPARVLPASGGLRATPIGERRWEMVDNAGLASLARRHPLTAEGDDIGDFDLAVACGAGGDSFDLSYVERRRAGEHWPLPGKLVSVNLRVGSAKTALRVASSERHGDSGELVSHAAGTVPAAMIRAFAAAGHHSMVIETRSGDTVTVIRVGNTGAQYSLPRLVAGCAKPIGDRAEAAVLKTGGMAPTK